MFYKKSRKNPQPVIRLRKKKSKYIAYAFIVVLHNTQTLVSR